MGYRRYHETCPRTVPTQSARVLSAPCPDAAPPPPRRPRRHVDLNQVVAYNVRAALRGWTQEEVSERLEPYLGQRLTQAGISASNAPGTATGAASSTPTNC